MCSFALNRGLIAHARYQAVAPFTRMLNAHRFALPPFAADNIILPHGLEPREACSEVFPAFANTDPTRSRRLQNRLIKRKWFP